MATCRRPLSGEWTGLHDDRRDPARRRERRPPLPSAPRDGRLEGPQISRHPSLLRRAPAGAGSQSRVVMEILGHSQIAVTMEVYPEALRDAADHMQAILGRESI